MRVLNRRGQNMAEYSILIALIIAAAIGIKVYVQRGVQARIHDESDAMNNTIESEDWSWNKDAAGATQNADVTMHKQFEPTDFSKKATTATSEDTEDYTLTKGGTTSTEITKKTKQAAEDYEQYNYDKTNNGGD